jgi:tripartite-type tricarboxylate transporter receptor subunit TctC
VLKESVDVMRRIIVCGVALVIATQVHAQNASGSAANYPDRPVKVIAPFAPGGVTDVIARLWAQRMSSNLGQQFYVENHAGGGSNLGMAAAARQAADGYSLMVGASSFTINPVLYKKIAYDPFKDFTAISLLAVTPGVLIVHPSLPAKSFLELIALVRANPGKYSYAMSGIGTPNRLLGELLKLSFQLDLVTVPFSGGGPAIQSTVAGHTPIAFVALTSIPALVEGGQLRALAVTGVKRSSVLPSVPTMLEMDVRGQEPDTFTGLLAPAGTPKNIIVKLNAETVKILAMADVEQQLASLGSEPRSSTPAEFDGRLKQEIAFWEKVAEDARIDKQ